MAAGLLRGKSALVTGGASGIGRAIALAFAREGARVLVHDLDRTGGEAAAQAAGGGALFISGDLRSPQQVREVAFRALEVGPVDILVNNAGFQYVAPVESFPEETWADMVQVMLTAPFQLIRALLPSMKERRWGRIINIASIHGLVASPFKAAYVAAKHGLVGLTKTVALEAGPYGVTVNAICPAYVRTRLVESQVAAQAANLGIPEQEVISRVMLAPAAIQRLIEPEEVAELAVYLASDKAAAVTGAVWTLDLGWTAR